MNADWSVFSHYAHVLACLAEDPQIRLRDVGRRVGVTERTAHRLISELDRAGILNRTKQGRRNTYWIQMDRRLHHPFEAHCTVGELLEFVLGPTAARQLRQRIADPAFPNLGPTSDQS